MTLPVLCLMGPTASGKTALGVALAQALGGEIVSVDSALVYRGLDIGTAKPTHAEQGGIEHHLLDICDPAEPYSAQQFFVDAMAAITAIHQAGKLPILVGGTMLYFRSLLAPMAALPAADPALRATLLESFARAGGEAMHARLSALDPVAARGVHPHNRQRLVRALEVCLLTGQPISELWQQQQCQPEAGVVTNQALGPVIQIGLWPQQRASLHARIEQRFEAMLKAGFWEEVLALRARSDLPSDCPALRTVGYRQMWQHAAGELSWEDAHAAALAATRQLAKRQLTWLRRWQSLQCFDMMQEDLTAITLNWVKQTLKRYDS